MSLVFAAITPHSPILMPQIGKEHTGRLRATADSFAKLKALLEESGAETLAIISPHGIVLEKAFTINLSPEFRCNFEDFGDFSAQKKWPGDIALAQDCRNVANKGASVHLSTKPDLDHGIGVPLCLLGENLPALRILPIYPSDADNSSHLAFGKSLGEVMISSNKKIAVIASGDLSHKLSKESPAGYSAKGKKFDHRLIESLQKGKYQDIVAIDSKLARDAGECGLRAILILLGILDSVRHKPQILSYEFPFGIGYLTMMFGL